MDTENQPKSRAEWFERVKEQSASGLSQIDFCKTHHLILSRFTYYKNLYHKKENKLKDVGSFSPVTISPSPVAKPCAIKIELPNGLSCHIPESIAMERLKQLIGVLVTC